MPELANHSRALHQSMRAMVAYSETGDDDRFSDETYRLKAAIVDALHHSDDDLLELVVYAIGVLPNNVVEDVRYQLRAMIDGDVSENRIAAMRVAAYGLPAKLAQELLTKESQARSFPAGSLEADKRDFLLKEVVSYGLAAEAHYGQA